MSKFLIVLVVACLSSILPIQRSNAAPSCTPTVSDAGSTRTLTFSNVVLCTWTVPTNFTVASTILIVGGGGGGGYYGNAGGGGAGALVVTSNFSMTPGATYDIKAGTGGAGSTAGGGFSGTESSFGSVIATGGGAGAGGDTTNGNATRFNNGVNGGSGGGGSSYTGALTSSGGVANAATGISAPWSAYGSNGAGGASNSGGGGGGAGGAGAIISGGAGRTYFGNVYAKGGSASQSVNQLIAGSGNGGNVIASGGTGSSGSVVIQYSLPTPIFSYARPADTTTVGNAFTVNSITSTGSSITSFSISPSLPSGVILDTSTGQISGVPTSLLSSTLFTVTAIDASGFTSTSNVRLVVLQTPASITVASQSTRTYKGVSVNLIATVNTAGKVRFFANGKRIANCLSINTLTSGSITATCAWKPTVQGRNTIMATISPTNSAFLAGGASQVSYFIEARTIKR